MKKAIKVLAIIAIITLSLIVLSCKDKDDDPQPHQSTITAFGKTAKVTGDASISTADFNTAVGNLQTILTEMDNAITGTDARERYANMLSRPGFQIIITTGSAGPNADANKSMTIGVSYLLTTEWNTIKGAINTKVVQDNAFAN